MKFVCDLQRLFYLTLSRYPKQNTLIHIHTICIHKIKNNITNLCRKGSEKFLAIE